MHVELYTDGVDEITVGGSIVRVDLVSLSPTERDANNAPKKVFCQRLIFSVESFANSVDVMQNALQGLVDAGVIRRNQPRALAEPHTASSAERGPLVSNSPPRSPNVSSNFR
jgi:S1-C subfamily serine protease